MATTNEVLPDITPEAVESPKEEPKQVAKKFDLKNYLNVRLDVEKGEYEKELRIRILTVDAHSSQPFQEIVMHNVKVPKEVAASGWKNYVCLEQTKDIDHEHFGTKCPFCEFRRKAYAEADKAKNAGDLVEEKRWKDIAKEYGSSRVAIIRCIERGKEAEGPKFWKFNIRSDKKDPMNQIRSLYDVRKKESIEDAKITNGGVIPEGFVPKNILSLQQGKDLRIVIKAVFENEKPTNKTSVTVIDCDSTLPLSTNQEQMVAWVNDSKIWSDVFVVKPYEYLSVILNGEIPWFDRNTNTWISKNSLDNTTVAKNNEKDKTTVVKSDDKPTTTTTEAPKAPVQEQSEDSLPF